MSGPLRPVLWTMQAKRRVLRRPGALLELIGRLRKPIDASPSARALTRE